MAEDELAAELEVELLGGQREFDRAAVAERSGVPEERGTQYWRALGFPDVEPGVIAFTERDVWALKTVQEFGEKGWLTDEGQIAMTRALGQTLSRLADWQLSALGSMVDIDTVEDDALDRARRLVPDVEQLIGYVWRRHLAAVVTRTLAAGDDREVRALVVGFADLVSFTRLTRNVDSAALARLVERFEGLAADIVAECGGRIVKTVGDEVLFAADHPDVGAEIGMRLSEMVTADEDLPDLRVGIACGSVVSRLGDVYGEPVNIASRLTSMARPGSVLVDRELAGVLEAGDRWQLHKAPPRSVSGYATLHPTRLRRGERMADSTG